MLSPIPGQPSVVMVQGDKSNHSVGSHANGSDQNEAIHSWCLATDGSLSQAMSGVSQSVAAAGAMKGSSKMASTAMMANPMVGGALMAGSLFAHRKQTVTEVWAVPGPKSETVIHNAQPTFEVHCDNIPGINPDDYQPVLLKLESTPNNYRLVGATKRKPTRCKAPLRIGECIRRLSKNCSRESAKVAIRQLPASRSASALPPGEYAVATSPHE